MRGTVKWFDGSVKGYGFIACADGRDAFVHKNDLDLAEVGGTLEAGDAVEFEVTEGPKGLKASLVRLAALACLLLACSLSLGAAGCQSAVQDVRHSQPPPWSNYTGPAVKTSTWIERAPAAPAPPAPCPPARPAGWDAPYPLPGPAPAPVEPLRYALYRTPDGRLWAVAQSDKGDK